ncbi:MAG: hypothetical protein LBJ02_05350 [Bifidobacteriaceae bacterium]|jgi:hypothetical protein|nr:hypothetical protein [Bifidobacteriaceae bacterium]
MGDALSADATGGAGGTSGAGGTGEAGGIGGIEATEGASAAIVEYDGERFTLPVDRPFQIGREGDLVVDDNPYLHRRVLQIDRDRQFWWLSNVGSRIAATLSDSESGMQAWLRPGAHMPLIFHRTLVVFTAGPCTYSVTVWNDQPIWRDWTGNPATSGVTTRGSITLTESQRQLIVALAEPLLRHQTSGVTQILPNASAATRLGWTLTKFNRKLDNVCDKLDRFGVDGLRGGPGALATQRRARLVEYAVSTGLVTPVDLQLLELPPGQVD